MKPITELLGNKLIRTSAMGGACITIGSAVWAAGDYTGVRPVIKKEFEITTPHLPIDFAGEFCNPFTHLSTPKAGDSYYPQSGHHSC